jgi:hypothetical protein
MDSREFRPFLEQSYNDMAIPVQVEHVVGPGADLDDLTDITKDLLREFTWYFHFDLLDVDAAALFKYITKKNIYIPKELTSSDNKKA